jgi:hypothetical protein
MPANQGRTRQARGEGLRDGHPNAAASPWPGPGPTAIRPTWSQFLRSQARGVLAADFFTVETAWLRTLYVFFVIEVHARCVHVAGATRRPNTAWVTQQARNLSFDLSEHGPLRFLIRDRDAKYPQELRRRLRSRPHPRGAHPVPRPAGERLGRALGEDLKARVPRLDAGGWSPPSGAGALRVRGFTTTRGARTVGRTCGRLTRGRILPLWPAALEACAGATSWAGSSMSTNWLHEAPIAGSAPFRLTEACTPRDTHAPRPQGVRRRER